MKKLIFALACVSVLLTSCDKTGKDQPGVATLEMYIAVADGQKQFIKTTIAYTGSDNQTRTIDIDALSYTTTIPACLKDNIVLKEAINKGMNVKYAKVASETGESCSIKAVATMTAVETPTDKIDYMFLPGYDISSSSSKKPTITGINAEGLAAKGLKVDAVTSWISRHNGHETHCSIEM